MRRQTRNIDKDKDLNEEMIKSWKKSVVHLSMHYASSTNACGWPFWVKPSEDSKAELPDRRSHSIEGKSKEKLSNEIQLEKKFENSDNVCEHLQQSASQVEAVKNSYLTDNSTVR